jgi:hypothetical protein
MGEGAGWRHVLMYGAEQQKGHLLKSAVFKFSFFYKKVIKSEKKIA